jgi:hypothetical protein
MNKIFTTIKRFWRKYMVFVEHGAFTAPMTSDWAECRYCGHTFQGNYCPRCGQNRNIGTKKPTMLRTFREAYPQLSNNYLRTLIQLVLRPGYMMRDYFRGHRVIYQSPLNALLLTMSVIALCIGVYHQVNKTEEKHNLELFVENVEQNAGKHKEGYDIFKTALDNLGLTRKGEKAKAHHEVLWTVLDRLTSSNVMLILCLLPMMGLASHIVCRKRQFGNRKLTIVEHYIIFVYLYVPITIFKPHALVEMFYYVWTYRGIYGISWAKAFGLTLRMILWSCAFGLLIVIILSTTLVFLALR